MTDTREEQVARKHKVSLLREMILDHTNSEDMFWLGEALLVAMAEVETQAGLSSAKNLGRAVMNELTRQVKAGCTHIASLNVNDLVRAILSTEAAPSKPVAWRWCNIFNKDHWIVSTEEPATHNEQYIVEPLYAHPPATKSNNGESK